MKYFKSYMKKALEQAKEAYKRAEIPVGAVLVDENNKVISMNHNRVIEMNDPTAHAEILCIREACQKFKNTYLKNCSIYVTLEPCPMCSFAISKVQIKNIFYGIDDPKRENNIKNSSKLYYINKFTPNTYSGFNEDEIRALMKKFFLKLRNKNVAPWILEY